VCVETGGSGGAGAHGGEIRAEFVGGDRGEQEKFAGEADLCAGDTVCRRAHGAVAGGTFFFAGRIGGGEGRGARASAGSGAEGGGEHRGVFLRAGEPAVGQEILQGWGSADSGKTRGQKQ